MEIKISMVICPHCGEYIKLKTETYNETHNIKKKPIIGKRRKLQVGDMIKIIAIVVII